LCNTNQTEDPGDEGDDIEDIEVDDPSSCSIRVAGREAADIDYLVTRNISVHVSQYYYVDVYEEGMHGW